MPINNDCGISRTDPGKSLYREHERPAEELSRGRHAAQSTYQPYEACVSIAQEWAHRAQR